ncbi:MAG: sulfatase [Bacteroidetes bacterium]|nr:sulfatase [Bacteroidota bacterium]
MKIIYRIFCLTSITFIAANFSFAQEQKKKPNVLFIAIDDLKPILGCYGDKQIKTPNIDRLAKMGTVFLSNYCQQAVCGPTRASIMTGMRPDYTKIWDLKTKMRDKNPDIVSIPQYFASKGYSSQGIGKVYDPRCVDKELDKPSWSVPYYKTAKKYYAPGYGEPALERYQMKSTKDTVEKYLQEALAKGMKKADANEYAGTKAKPTTECVDVPDNAYNDGANALQAKDILIDLSKKNEPFFFAVGFAKPHLPFVSPKKYWDLYNREEMPLAPFQEKTANAVEAAYHNAGEIRGYTDIPSLTSFKDQKNYGITLPVDKQKELIHGYYAAVSYTDANVGILLNTLDSLGLTSNTIIVLWGDHGWHLGDHNLWCKHTNFEQATRTPLIISSPKVKSSKTNSTTEFVDIFPTLCDLAGLEIPTNLAGKSLVSLMKKPTSVVKEYAVSQYPRSNGGTETDRSGYADSKVMGYSIRNQQYRFTLWMGNNYRSSQPFNKDYIIGTELYDYKNDPLEKVNVAKETKYTKVSKKMYQQIIDFFKSQQKQ